MVANIGATTSSRHNFQLVTGVTWGKVVVHVTADDVNNNNNNNNNNIYNNNNNNDNGGGGGNRRATYRVGEMVRMDGVELRAGEGVVMIMMLDDGTF